MRRIERAAREAQRVLAELSVDRVPVPVDEIAGHYAHVLKRKLDDAISGMLVPLESTPTDKEWAIVVNSQHARVRQRFTIAHELGHLLLHRFTSPHADRGFKVRFRDQRSSDGQILEEIEANHFAAELLLPQRLLRERIRQLNLEYVPLSTDQQDAQAMRNLARDFGVSQQALSIRLSALLA